MRHESSFSVSRFKKRNGVFSFLVDAYLNGNRLRRNFKTREEAAAEPPTGHKTEPNKVGGSSRPSW